MKKKKLIASMVLSILCAACAPKPTDSEVLAVLTQNVPQNYKEVVAVDQTQSEISAAGDETLVKFKTSLKLNQPLFEAAEFDAVGKAAGADVAPYGEIDKGIQVLLPGTRDKLSAQIQAATTKPLFLKETSPAGAAVEWYGSFKAKKVVDKWISSDFKTDIDPKFKGRPRSEFPDSAIDSANANSWFSELKIKQLALLQKIDTAQQLEKKDADAAQAQIDSNQMLAQKEAELEQARAIARREQTEKQALIKQQQKQARQLPLRVNFRHAAIGGTSVIRFESPLAMTLKMEASRGAQTLTRDLQLVPGRLTEFGHLEGWGFKPGDRVTLSNPSFDAVSLIAP